MADNIQATLAERGKRYGGFEEHAELSVNLLTQFEDRIRDRADELGTPVDEHYPAYMQESIKLIMHKLARIANGDPHYDDSWRDIAGYATLVVDILNKKTQDEPEEEVVTLNSIDSDELPDAIQAIINRLGLGRAQVFKFQALEE